MTREVLALIPARGGSKGVPGKNKRLVAGKPLITYSIDAARETTSLTRIVVSTDDPEIAEIAHASGVQVVMRPAELAQDASPVIDAVRHTLTALHAEDGFEPEAIVLLQPTSPFRSPEQIDHAVNLFFANGNVPVCSVCQCEDGHPARMYRIEEGRLHSLMPELSSARRQDLPAIYHRNGSMYVFGMPEVDANEIIGDAMQPFVMPPESSVNVDTEIDLLLVGAIMERKGGNPTART